MEGVLLEARKRALLDEYFDLVSRLVLYGISTTAGPQPLQMRNENVSI